MKLSRKDISLGVLVLVGVVSVLAAVLLVVELRERFRGQASGLDASTYQAVFLTNDQVYFGILIHPEAQFPVLSDVFYVQLNGSVEEFKSQGTSPTGKIVRLGKSEPHGPANKMILNRDHILFYENLRPDSSVLRIIQGLKSQD